MRRVYIESRQLYGSPKVAKKLNHEGIKVSQKTVSRIMNKEGMKSRTVKKHKATTNSKHNHPVHENVLNQHFTVTKPNEVWVADITYIPTDEGWLYLASIMDLYSRKIVGWHIDCSMKKELVLSALKQAYQRQQPQGSILHHSDRGSQYASNDYQAKLMEYGMKCSMSRLVIKQGKKQKKAYLSIWEYFTIINVFTPQQSIFRHPNTNVCTIKRELNGHII